MSLLLADGFDAAFVGVAEVNGVSVAVYDKDKCIHVLRRRDRMSREDAMEFYEFNVAGANVGPQTPIFVDTMTIGMAKLIYEEAE